MKNRKLKADNYHVRHTERSFKNQLRRKASVKLRINQKLIEERLKNKPNWNTNDIVSQFLSADPSDVSESSKASNSNESGEASKSDESSKDTSSKSDESSEGINNEFSNSSESSIDTSESTNSESLAEAKENCP